MPVSDKFRIVCQADEAAITIYDVIDPFWGISAKDIANELKAAGDKVKTIRLRLNSPGGSVFEGTAIYNVLKQHPARVLVNIDGMAASMASVVAMAGDEIEMGEGAYLMVHDPIGSVWKGDSTELREMADLLDKMKDQLVGIYSRRTGRTEEDIRQLMAEETWMTATEAVAEKFADRTVPGLAVAASFDPARFSRIPQALLKGAPPMADAATTPVQPGPATFDELTAAFPKASAEFLVSQQACKATMSQAQAAYQAMLEKRAEEMEAKAAAAEKSRFDAEAKLKAGASGQTIVPEVGGTKVGGDNSGDPIAAWESALEALEAKGIKHAKAISKLVKENPEMHAAYLEAYNLKHAAARR